MSHKYTIIFIPKEGGEPEIREVEGEENGIGLETLQKLVEGRIEYVPLDISPYKLDLYINDVGMYTHDLNIRIPLGSEHAGAYMLHGPVVVCQGDEEGYTVGFSPEFAKKLLPFFRACWQRCKLSTQFQREVKARRDAR